MSKIFLIIIVICLLCTTQNFAQVIHISLDLKNHKNDAANITGCVLEPNTANYKMYIHSGVCSATTPNVPDSMDCQDPTYVWEHVVGDWGQDNGFGLMTEQLDSIWDIYIDVDTFYSNPATISQTGQGSAGASTPKPMGASAYSMGFVFRNEDGTIGGITGGCTDFFVFNLHQGNTNVDVGLPGFTLPDTVFSVNNSLNPTSVREVVNVSFETAYPNPFTNQIKFTYHVPKTAKGVDFSIYNTLGQKIRTLYYGDMDSGVYTILWDGKSDSGSEVQQGAYYAIISNGKSSKFEVIIKQ